MNARTVNLITNFNKLLAKNALLGIIVRDLRISTRLSVRKVIIVHHMQHMKPPVHTMIRSLAQLVHMEQQKG